MTGFKFFALWISFWLSDISASVTFYETAYLVRYNSLLQPTTWCYVAARNKKMEGFGAGHNLWHVGMAIKFEFKVFSCLWKSYLENLTLENVKSTKYKKDADGWMQNLADGSLLNSRCPIHFWKRRMFRTVKSISWIRQNRRTSRLGGVLQPLQQMIAIHKHTSTGQPRLELVTNDKFRFFPPWPLLLPWGSGLTEYRQGRRCRFYRHSPVSAFATKQWHNNNI